MAKLKLEIITAERPVYTAEDVDLVLAPGIEGQLGILPSHAALMTMLQPGELLVRKGKEEVILAVSGGYLEVLDNRVIVLADAAERAEEIDIARAEAAKKRAEERLKARIVDVDLSQAEAAMRRSLARIKVAERYRRRREAPPS